MLTSLTDVDDTPSATVTAANQGGLLVRDTSVVAAGSPGAWKNIDVLDLGTF